MKKVLFIKPGSQTFIESDVYLLKTITEVEVYSLKTKPLKSLILKSLTAFFKIIWFRNSYSCVYVWFADYHSFLPVLASKIAFLPSIIVIGGYDAAKLPNFNYGAHITTFRSLIIKLSCRLATKIFPVSKFSENSLFQNIKVNLNEKSKVIYNLIRTDIYYYSKDIIKDNSILTIASANDLKTLKIKGLDFFKNLSEFMPNHTFKIIGVSKEAKIFLEKNKPSNLEIISYLPHNQLVTILQKASIITQFSIHESFGVALGEGMACGCVPITISDLGAAEIIPENLGFKIEKQDLLLAKNAIIHALKYSEEQRNEIANHIKMNFNENVRLEKLLNHFPSLDKKRE